MEAKFKNDKHFEERIVQAIIHDHQFAEQMLEVLEVHYFNYSYLSELAEEVFSYYKNYKSFPSYMLLGTLIKKKEASTALKQQMMEYWLRIKRDPLNGDLEYVKEESLDFCKKRRLVRALESSLDLIDEKKYEQVVKVIEKAVLAGSDRDVGHVLKEQVEDRMVVETRKTIPTPWPDINAITDGGVSGGELCVICAGTGVGKSHVLVDVGVDAAQKGFNVVHFTFELGDKQIGKRYDARLTNIPPEQHLDNKEKIQEANDQLAGNVIIKSFPTKSITTLGLKNSLQKIALKQDVRPDLLIVDYGDLMRSQHKYEQKRLEEESVYEDLRALSQELNIPIWTATQTNREGSDVEVVTLKHVAECFGKAMISDLFITMARKKENSQNTLGNFYIAKSRIGPDGIKFPILVNTATSRILVLQPDALDVEDGQEVSSMHEYLKKKFREHQKKGTGVEEDND